jgi:small-conductance mechanosensitive channel
VGYRVLAGAVLATHFAYLGYLVLGGFLAWRWVWTVWPHTLAALWGVLVVGLSLSCPLTWAENWARRRAGEPPLAGGFIDRYITGVLYPAQYTAVVRVLVALVVIGSWVGVYLRWRRAA